MVVADLGGRLDGTGASNEPADAVVKEIEAAGGEAVATYASVADESGAAAIVDTALSAFGRVDVVVNNAGIAAPDRFEDVPVEQFRQMIDVHYLGSVYMLKAAWPHLVAQGYGRVVNTCSEAMLGIHGKITSYAGAKAGVFGLTRSLASESARHGIQVNAIMPRAATRLSDISVLAHTFDMPEEMLQGTMTPFRPELVAPATAYLAHESCRLNGEVLAAGAGQVQRLVISETQGITDDALTPETVAVNIDRIIDDRDAIPMTVQSEIQIPS